MSGSDAFSVTQPGVPAFEVSVTEPNDGGQPLVYGSAATTVTLTDIVQPSTASVERQDVGVEDPFVEVLSPVASQEPAVGGSAQVLGNLPPQQPSAYVIKEDPNVANLDPGLALPYGNNDTGVTGTIILAPTTGGPQGAEPDVDPGVLGSGATETLGAGTNDAITSSQPHAPLTGGPVASGGVLLTGETEDPGQSFTPQAQPSGLAASTNDFTTEQPHAPQTQGPNESTATTTQRVDVQESGAVGQDVRPPVQYGQSAP